MKNLFLKVAILFLLSSGCKKDNPNNPGTSWKILTSMPTARHDFGLVECNNLLYAIGGYNADALNKVEVYNPANNSWHTKAPMPTARGYLVVGTVSNKIYAIGGISGSNLNNITYTNVTEEYDPALDKWTVKSPCPITSIPFNSVFGNRFMAGAAINGKIYVSVGTSEGTDPTYIYDPATDSWSNTGKGITHFNFTPYYSASNTNSSFVSNGNSFLQYLSVDNEWRILQPFSATRHRACLAADDNNVYSIGGYDQTVKDNNYQITMSNEVGIYNLKSSSWTKTDPLNIKRYGAGAVIYNGHLYVAGGATAEFSSIPVPLASLEVMPLK